MQEYLDLPNVVAVGGSWMIDKSALAQGDWDALTAYAEQKMRPQQK
jgi:2-keto-3-deoxy-6-phosphogluconate aldolase